MHSKADLQRQLREIDHKGYKAYKVLEGEYDFDAYRLAIDHVQGDPFATPSRVRIVYNNRGNIAPEYFATAHRRIAVEDYLLRRLHRYLRAGRGNDVERLDAFAAAGEREQGPNDTDERRYSAMGAESQAQHQRRGGRPEYAFGNGRGGRPEYVHDNGGGEHAGYGRGYGRRRGDEAGSDHMDGRDYAGRRGESEGARGGRVSSGSGKSGLVTACRTGQEILERTAVRITPEVIEARIEVGFPAYGRTIAAGELGKILFDFLPQVTEKTFHLQKKEAAPARGQSEIARLPFGEALDAVVALADDQQYIRDALDGLGLVAFVADGSILPRESGVSQRPMKSSTRSAAQTAGTRHSMKSCMNTNAEPVGAQYTMKPYRSTNTEPVGQQLMKTSGKNTAGMNGGSSDSNENPPRTDGLAVAFESPESLAVTLNLPHRGLVRGMGIKKGITLIAGGGFHGKSTLLKALERGVYNHIAGDGRELVITDASAFKLRAEEGRCIHETDISMFISNLPTRVDTTRFSTENASGSTSQAANTVEALAAGSRVLLIDEDTSATNFMVRDGRMAQLVSDEKEPITPFIRKIRGLYQSLGVSTILVVGSSGDYLEVADTVLQMDCYVAKDVTARAKELCGQLPNAVIQPTGSVDRAKNAGRSADSKSRAEAAGTEKEAEIISSRIMKSAWLKKAVRPKQIEKARVHGWDTLSLDKTEVDLRYLEQIVDESQTAALAYVMQYVLGRLANGKKTAAELAEEAVRKIERDGILSVTPKNYGAGAAAAVRRQEILACLARYRML
ncbi:MAG: ABC-ATPase domain-containing protein [Lachnospiraceae bacterium]|nr:ABC-ATPase domain-containing protein [Lachnospiraceae bacterium]